MDETQEQRMTREFEGEKEFQALQQIISALKDIDNEGRRRILSSAATFLKVDLPLTTSMKRRPEDDLFVQPQRPSFSEDTSMSPKDFMFEKQPQTDVERVACLAFYLTHYRDTPQFKTLDISLLNTEAAQPKFSNTANSVSNAVKRGYLVPASKGNRQLSAAGEQFVRALPDRVAAMEAMTAFRPRKNVRKKM